MRIFYVCTGNSFRSPTAEALTRKYTNHDVESAGTRPALEIARNAKALLKEVNADQFTKPAPECITQRAIDLADKVIAMREHHKSHLLEHFRISHEDIEVWHVKDPINGEVTPEEAFRKIEEKVKSL